MTPTSPPASAPARSRRLGRFAPLLPVAIALLYAAVHGFLAHKPSLAAMVPDDAFVVWRYKDLAAYDAAHAAPPGPAGETPAAPSAVLGAELNVPELPGVARDRTLLEAWLDPAARVDPRFFVLPVADGGRLMDRFRDPDLRERHARHVVVHGDWAAAAWDQSAARTAGLSSGTLPSLDGDALWSVTADWPRLVDYTLQPTVATEPPYADVLAALGFRPSSAKSVDDATTGPAVAVELGRVGLVRDAWTRVTLTAFPDRLRATLTPAATSELVALLAKRAGSSAPAGDGSPLARAFALAPPADADAWIRMPDADARKIVTLALWYAGVSWPDAVTKDGFAALRLDGGGALLVAAAPSPGLVPAWTLVLAGAKSAIPELSAFGLPAAPAVGASTALAEGQGRLRAPFGGTPIAGEIAARALASLGIEGDSAPIVIALGAGAESRATLFAANARGGERPADARGTLIADAFLERFAAQRLLGRALEPGGLLCTLAASDLAVSLSTDGRDLIVEIRKTRRAAQ